MSFAAGPEGSENDTEWAILALEISERFWSRERNWDPTFSGRMALGHRSFSTAASRFYRCPSKRHWWIKAGRLVDGRGRTHNSESSHKPATLSSAQPQVDLWASHTCGR
jgi:hypothetical protein